jgi:hypothetical protein
VPTEAVTFGLSDELGNFRIDGDEEAAFTAVAQEAEARGRGFLARVDDCQSLLSSLESISAETTDQRLLREVRAHCLVSLSRDQDAVQELEAVGPLDSWTEETAEALDVAWIEAEVGRHSPYGGAVSRLPPAGASRTRRRRHQADMFAEFLRCHHASPAAAIPSARKGALAGRG